LSSIEPADVSAELIRLAAGEPRLAPHLHIPLQSGDDGVLQRMQRHYKARDFEGLIRRLEKKIPDFCLSTDVMVGFPGETDHAFDNTLRLLTALRPLKVHVFPYSARKGTAAYGFEDPVPSRIIRERLDACLELAAELADQRKSMFLGRRLGVLVEDHDRRNGLYRGHTAHYLPAAFKSTADTRGREVTMLAEKVHQGSLYGKLLSQPQREAVLESRTL
jgi:threonylcarbamoyladenosine tRNA methylthiotransferase MtaB